MGTKSCSHKASNYCQHLAVRYDHEMVCRNEAYCVEVILLGVQAPEQADGSASAEEGEQHAESAQVLQEDALAHEGIEENQSAGNGIVDSPDDGDCQGTGDCAGSEELLETFADGGHEQEEAETRHPQIPEARVHDGSHTCASPSQCSDQLSLSSKEA